MVKDNVVINKIITTKQQAPKLPIMEKRALKKVRTKKPSSKPTSDINMALVSWLKTLETKTFERQLTRSKPN